MTTGTSRARQIGEKTFSCEEQRVFAQVSRDCNPMHVDPVAARRLMTGRQVVHGIHILLSALEFWQNDTASPPLSIACSFSNPLSVGEPLVFRQFCEADNTSTVEASVNGLLCASITLATAREQAPTQAWSSLDEATPGGNICTIGKLAQPLDEAAESHVGKQYALGLDDADLSALFPNSLRYLGKEGVASTLALSFFVGMVCPGLHSVFSSLKIDLHVDEALRDDHLRFRVLKYDDRFRLFDIAFRGCIQGVIKAFLRPPAQSQPSLEELSAYVQADEFKGSRSLIIGGSRGLGEVTAKILAAGGGDVILTYASGRDDARIICDEINARQRSHCQVEKLDLTTDSFNSVNIDWNSLHSIYFFATPRIFRKKAELFDSGLFHEFCDFYIGKFYGLCTFLETSISTGRIKVYFPSSVYVEERPRGMAEYAMAKSAAELLIQEINRTFHKLTVSCTRLPRLSTDQTVTILKVSTGSNAATLLPLIRSMHA